MLVITSIFKKSVDVARKTVAADARLTLRAMMKMMAQMNHRWPLKHRLNPRPSRRPRRIPPQQRRELGTSRKISSFEIRFLLSLSLYSDISDGHVISSQYQSGATRSSRTTTECVTTRLWIARAVHDSTITAGALAVCTSALGRSSN